MVIVLLIIIALLHKRADSRYSIRENRNYEGNER